MTVTSDSISAVDIVSHSENVVIAEPALRQIPANIVKYQSLGVDSVSGATVTSHAILEAATSSLSKAGGNMLRLKQPVQVSRKAVYENVSVDVVVLGSGMAGFAAAVAAAENGASVLLLEKMPMRGGSSGRSAGALFYSEDAKGLSNFIMERADNKADPAVVNAISAKSAEIYRWMLKLGLKYNEEKLSMMRIATPSPSGALAGMRSVNALYAQALEHDVDIRLNTTGEKLVLTKGVVTGIIARTNEGTLVCNAKAVIIATGGYDHSPDMQRKYAGYTVGMPSETSVGNTGDGIRMAEAIGAATIYHGGKAAILYAYADIQNAPRNFIIINSQGQRIVDETAFYDSIGEAMAMNRSVDKRFYRVYDSSSNTTGLEQAYKEQKALRADNIEDLAKLMNLSVSNLTQTVNRYNSYSGKPDPDFGKSSAHMVALTKAPFYALKTEPRILATIGGIKINERAEVVDKKGKIIPGLYAAGETANGTIFYQDYAYTGSALLFSLATGRIAGENAARYVIR